MKMCTCVQCLECRYAQRERDGEWSARSMEASWGDVEREDRQTARAGAIEEAIEERKERERLLRHAHRQTQ